jgi:integrase
MSVKGSITRSDYIPWDIAMEKVMSIKDSNPVMASVIAFGINTGLRIGDLLSIRVEDIENGTLLLKEKKTKKHRKVVMNDWLVSFMRSRSLSNRSGYAFSRNGHAPVTVQSVNRTLKTLFGGLDVNVSSHSLRKTFGRRVMEQSNYSDAALMKLCELFNHSSPATTRIYLGLRQEELDEVYMNLI